MRSRIHKILRRSQKPLPRDPTHLTNPRGSTHASTARPTIPPASYVPINERLATTTTTTIVTDIITEGSTTVV